MGVSTHHRGPNDGQTLPCTGQGLARQLSGAATAGSPAQPGEAAPLGGCCPPGHLLDPLMASRNAQHCVHCQEPDLCPSTEQKTHSDRTCLVFPACDITATLMQFLPNPKGYYQMGNGELYAGNP